MSDGLADLSGKVAIITGGGRGQGEAATRRRALKEGKIGRFLRKVPETG